MNCSAKIFTFLLTLLLGQQHVSYGKNKDFTSYYKQVNAAEELFVNNDISECLKAYDHVFKEYKDPFVKDCYIAAEIAYSTGDTARFLNYLNLAFINGMPVSALDAAPILKEVITNAELYGKIKILFAQSYLSVKPLTADLDTLELLSYKCDSLKRQCEKTRSKNDSIIVLFVASEENFRSFVYHKYISNGVFPLEKITGIKTDTTDAAFERRFNKADLYPEAETGNPFAGKGVQITSSAAIKEETFLSNTLAFNIFIHSTCAISEYGAALWQCVLNGYMHPKDYGMLEEMCISWNRDNAISGFAKICNYEKKDAYYNILGYNPRHSINTFVTGPALLEEVEKNRADHLMQKYSVDVQKHQLEKEKGYRFFFGFSYYR